MNETFSIADCSTTTWKPHPTVGPEGWAAAILAETKRATAQMHLDMQPWTDGNSRVAVRDIIHILAN
jgi:hypothetical protein